MDLRFDALANEYDKWFAENHHLFDAEVEAVASVMEAGVKYVEIGVGTGIFAALLGIGEGVEHADGMAEFKRRRLGVDHRGLLFERYPACLCRGLSRAENGRKFCRRISGRRNAPRQAVRGVQRE